MNCYPIIEILPFRQTNHLPQINARLETGLSLFVQRVPNGSSGEAFLWPKSLEKQVESRVSDL